MGPKLMTPKPHSANAKRKSIDDDDEGKKPGKMPNPTDDEKNEIVEYMERHQNYAQSRLRCPNARQKKEEMNKKLAEKVNNVKNLRDANGNLRKGGPNRSGDQWWKTWISMKNSAKAYAAENYKAKDYRTGGGAPNDTISSVTETEEKSEKESFTCGVELYDRIMNILGWHNSLGLGINDELAGKIKGNRNRSGDEALQLHDDEPDLNDEPATIGEPAIMEGHLLIEEPEVIDNEVVTGDLSFSPDLYLGSTPRKHLAKRTKVTDGSPNNSSDTNTKPRASENKYCNCYEEMKQDLKEMSQKIDSNIAAIKSLTDLLRQIHKIEIVDLNGGETTSSLFGESQVVEVANIPLNSSGFVQRNISDLFSVCDTLPENVFS